MKKNKNFNIHLIGAGRMGMSHAKALKQLGYELTSVCDYRLEARESVQKLMESDDILLFEKADQLLATKPNLDLVIIATTADTHCQLVTQCASAGAKKILLEKPYARSLLEADTISSVVNKHNCSLALNHQLRFVDQYKIIKDILREGALGELVSFNVTAGCFGLSMNGSHYIEIFCYLTNLPVEKACGLITGSPVPSPRGPDFFDQAGHFQFINKKEQCLNLHIPHNQGHGMTFTLAGEYGHVLVDELAGEAIITTRKPEHRNMPSTRYGMPWLRQSKNFPMADNVTSSMAMIEALIADKNYPDCQQGRNVIAALIAACYSSENEGRLINMADESSFYHMEFAWA